MKTLAMQNIIIGCYNIIIITKYWTKINIWINYLFIEKQGSVRYGILH